MRIGSPSLVNARRKPSLIAGSGITSVTEDERSSAPEATRRITVSTSSRSKPMEARTASSPPTKERSGGSSTRAPPTPPITPRPPRPGPRTAPGAPARAGGDAHADPRGRAEELRELDSVDTEAAAAEDGDPLAGSQRPPMGPRPGCRRDGGGHGPAAGGGG